jgi:Fe-S cluster assembly protein SufD
MPKENTGQRATVERYVSDFARRSAAASASSPEWLEEIRNNAIERFREVGFPSSRDEKWRFTNFSHLATTKFALGNGHTRGDSTQQVDAARLGWWSDLCVVFVDGKFSRELSSLDGLPNGVVAGNLAELMGDNSAALKADLARVADSVDSPFTALNTAFFSDGGILWVPRGVRVESPIQFLYVTSDGIGDSVTHPRNLVVVGENAQATVVECYVGAGNGCTWSNIVTEFVLANAAHLTAHRVQQEGANAFHTATTQCHQGRDSTISFSTVDFGGSLSRHDLNFKLNGAGASCSLYGLSHLRDQQHADNQTNIVHSTPHCTSVERFNGIFDDNSHGVFTGRILVEPGAQQTDAIQSSRNLLLSDNARADTQPQLEIFADDVKCTHGATVGPIDDEALFYLRSKGIAADDARSMLTYGFAAEIIDTIGIESLRDHLEARLRSRLGGDKRDSREDL